MSQSEMIERIIVYAQQSASPSGLEQPGTTSVVPIWDYDNPISLLRAGFRMAAQSKSVDTFLFNLHLTCFGRTRMANVVGLLLPPFLRWLTRKTVFVYLHNTLETQELEKLGYMPSKLARAGVQLLERLILRTSRTIVPLASQQSKITKVLGRTPAQFVIPFLEGAYAASLLLRQPLERIRTGIGMGQKVLLFGTWGPQKDLAGALQLLTLLRKFGDSFEVTVAGPVNSHFPELQSLMDRLALSRYPATKFIGPVPEESLGALFLSHSLVLLPYKATGGYSAAMNAAASLGTRIVAYDVAELREFDQAIGGGTIFVNPDNPEFSARILQSVLEQGATPVEGRLALISRRRDIAASATNSFLRMLSDRLTE